MYQAKSGVKNFSLYWDWGPPPPENLRPGTPPGKSETWDPPWKIWDLGPPWKIWDWGPPRPWLDQVPPLPGPGPGTPPPPVEVWTDTQSENITFPILRMRAVTNMHAENWLKTEDLSAGKQVEAKAQGVNTWLSKSFLYIGCIGNLFEWWAK